MTDVNLFGGRGGAPWGGVVVRLERGSNRVPQTDRQCFVICFEAGKDYLHPANQLGINYSTTRNIIRVWLQDSRVETRRQGGTHSVVVTGAMDEAIGGIALAAPFMTLTGMKQQLLQLFYVQRQLNGEDSMVSGWQASTSIIVWSTLMREWIQYFHVGW